MAENTLDTPGKRLQFLRKNAGISQTQLAEIAGVTQSFVSRVERELAPVHSIVAIAARTLSCSTDYLLMVSNDPRPVAPASESRGQPPEDVDQMILRMMINEVPPPNRANLVRFLIRQVGVYKDVVPQQQSND